MVHSTESSVAGLLSPQTTQSVNGFPVTFRQVTLADGAILWVPRGISRNDEVRGWRIYMAHEGGLLVANIPDYHGTAQNSLAEAYKILLDAMQGLVSRFVVDERSRVPGHD